jgi:hypothetical protein
LQGWAVTPLPLFLVFGPRGVTAAKASCWLLQAIAGAAVTPLPLFLVFGPRGVTARG